MKKRWASGFLGLMLVFAAAGDAGVPALDVPPLSARVNDTAGMLSPAAAAALEAKLTQKNEVLSELMEEHVKLKKTLGAG